MDMIIDRTINVIVQTAIIAKIRFVFSYFLCKICVSIF